jgi:Acetyltransferase (GNAT) domain
MRYYPAPYGRASVEQWIERNRQRYQHDGVGLWAMELKKTQEFIGDCGIILQQVEGEPLYEIGYHLRRDLWGQGLATEAAIACRNWAFTHLKADRLISLIRPENLPPSSRTQWHDHLEGSELARPRALRVFHRKSAGRPTTTGGPPIKIVIPSEARDLHLATNCRSLASLGMTMDEGCCSRGPKQVLRCAQDDK